VIWLAVIIAASGLIGLFVWWATRPRHPGGADEPVPYWPATNPCTWCKPSPEGICTCTGKCGHVRCVGDHTSMATLTAKDMRLLHKWIREGHK
jgi:hypothetical protein